MQKRNLVKQTRIKRTSQTDSRKRIIRLSPDKLQLVHSNRHFRKKYKVSVQADKY